MKKPLRLVWNGTSGIVDNGFAMAPLDVGDKPRLSWPFDILHFEPTAEFYEADGAPNRRAFTSEQRAEIEAYINGMTGTYLPAPIGVSATGELLIWPFKEAPVKIARIAPPSPADYWVYNFARSEAEHVDVWELHHAVDQAGVYQGTAPLKPGWQRVPSAPKSHNMRWDATLGEWYDYIAPADAAKFGLGEVERVVIELQSLFVTVAPGRGEIYANKAAEAAAIVAEIDDSKVTRDRFPFIVREAQKRAELPRALATIIDASFRTGYVAMAIIEANRAVAREGMKAAQSYSDVYNVLERFRNDCMGEFADDPVIAAWKGATS